MAEEVVDWNRGCWPSLAFLHFKFEQPMRVNSFATTPKRRGPRTVSTSWRESKPCFPKLMNYSFTKVSAHGHVSVPLNVDSHTSNASRYVAYAAAIQEPSRGFKPTRGITREVDQNCFLMTSNNTVFMRWPSLQAKNLFWFNIFQKFPAEISFWQFGRASERGFSVYVTFQVSRKKLWNNLALWICGIPSKQENKKSVKRKKCCNIRLYLRSAWLQFGLKRDSHKTTETKYTRIWRAASEAERRDFTAETRGRNEAALLKGCSVLRGQMWSADFRFPPTDLPTATVSSTGKRSWPRENTCSSDSDRWLRLGIWCQSGSGWWF